MKEVIKSTKAITLIALVVTIVVLLILAGVSISMLTGENGIITQTQEAKEDTRGATAKEEIDLWKLNIEMDNLTDLDIVEEEDELLNRLVTNGTLKQDEADRLKDRETIKIGKIEISLDEKTGDDSGGADDTSLAGKKYETETDIMIGDTSITVPGGATISGIEGEYENPEKGIVIYIIPEGEPEITDWEADSDENGIIDVHEKYDQFVWIPVPNPVATSETELATMINEGKYPIAVAINGTDSKGLQNYRGTIYSFSLSDDATKVNIKLQTTYYKEPAYLNDSSFADASSKNDIGITESLLQEEFNKMVDRVKNKKGFWVGRYETSNMSSEKTKDSTQQIKVIKGTTTGINRVSWYRMYAQQKNYSKLGLESSTISTSSMIWGSQWDQIMIWMKDVRNEAQNSFYVVNSVGMGNYGDISGIDDGASSKYSPARTGYNEKHKVKNIYDLAGNAYDWSIEALISDYATSRVLRGGYFNESESSMTRACSNMGEFPYAESLADGSRTTLY